MTAYDQYAEVLDAEVKRILDVHAPLRLPAVAAVASMTAVNCLKKAKQHHRRLKRRYRRRR